MIDNVELLPETHIYDFVCKLWTEYQFQNQNDKPILIGLQGPQGSGKTTLVNKLVPKLESQLGLNCLFVSMDDFYLPHEKLVKFHDKHASNTILQWRNMPGTHELELLNKVLEELQKPKRYQDIFIPKFDKSLNSGQGDRIERSKWSKIDQHRKLHIILIEGCWMGQKAIDSQTLDSRYRLNKNLSDFSLEELRELNEQLVPYRSTFNQLDALIQLMVEDFSIVSQWRLQQEKELIEHTGNGMSEEMVLKFVKCNEPAYILYSEDLAHKFIKDKQNKHLCLVLDDHRKVIPSKYYCL